jgi:peptidoglycan/xylan/chitin deacetylase (PgdA/CDA1 family)
MDKSLIKIYIFFIIALVIFINILPSIFININNTIHYIKTKTILAFEKREDSEINIYEKRANVIIMLDDGWKTQYTVGYNYMHKKDMRGSIAVIPALVGEYEYMNISNLYELYDRNWDLLNHTYSHIILNENNVDKQTYEMNKASNWLEKNGFINPYKILIYPEGEYDSSTIMIMKKLGYISGRSVLDGFNPKKPTNLYEVKVQNVLSDTNLDDVYEWIDYDIDYNLTLILLFHRLENDIDKTQMKYRVDDFYKIIDYIDERRDKLNIITYSEWIQSIV